MLPRFSQNPSNRSLAPLSTEFVQNYRSRLPVDAVAKLLFPGERQPEILDFGSGRGPMVAWLKARGFKAFGVEISEEYVRNADTFFGPGIITLLDQNGRSSFPDGKFDLVLSNQVLEHVLPADDFAREAFRLTSRGGYGIHVFPNLLRPMEPHLYQPCVHWLPQGPARRALIALLRGTGVGADWFKDYSLRDQAKIFDRFLAEETAYRSPGEWQKIFQKAGFDVAIASESDVKKWATGRSPHLLQARRALSPSSVLTRNFKQTVLLMQKPA